MSAMRAPKTPEKSTFIDSSNLSFESSPMTVKDYKQNVENLVYENFTLKSLLWQLNRKLTNILQSNNIESDLGQMLIEQEKKIAELENELVNAHLRSPLSAKDGSLDLKERLDDALDENRRLRELTEMNEGAKLSVPDEESAGEYSDLELVEKRKVLSICRDRIAELEEENKRLEDEAKQLIEEKDAMQDEIDKLNARIGEMEKSGRVSPREDMDKDIAQKIDEFEREIQELQDAEKAREDEMEELKDENSDLKQKISDLQRQLEEAHNLQNEPQDTQSLIKALRAAQDENVVLKGMLEHRDKDLDASENEEEEDNNLKKLSEENDELRGQIEDYQEQIDRLKKGSEATQDSLKAALNENALLKEKLDQLEQQLEDDGDEVIKRLTDENNDLKAHLEELQEQIQAMPNDEENDDLREQLSKLMKENDDAKMREDELRNELQRLNRTQNGSEDDQVHELRKQNQELTRENEELKTQIEILSNAHQDLEKEIDSLRQMPRLRDEVGTSPAKSPYRTPKAATPMRTPSAKSPQITAVRSSPFKSENQTLKKQNELLNAQIMTDAAARKSLSNGLARMLQSFARKSTQLQDQVDQRMEQLEARFGVVLKKLFGFVRLYNEDSREAFNSFMELNKMMFSDIRRGALICIKGSEKIAKTMARAPITRDDRRTLTKLQKKWQATIGGLLGNYIKEANELSMFSGFSPLRKDDSERVVKQCQILIHAIWKAFGNGKEEPDVTRYRTYGVRFESIVKNVVNIQEEGVADLKERLKSVKSGGIPSVPASSLSPAVVDLIRMVAENVKEASRSLHSDHRELMKTAGYEVSRSQSSRSTSRT